MLQLSEFLLMPFSLLSQGGEDFMRSSGKINVVYGVILIIFVGLILYVIRLDKRLKKLENNN